MTSGHLARVLGLFLCFAVPPVHAQSRDEEPPASDLVHSDLPLFGDETQDKWPQHFTDPDPDSLGIGCTSRIAFGDWTFRQPAADADEEPTTSWYRIRNYGVFHCYAVVGSADEREELAGATIQYSFFVLLGKTRDRSGPIELWALQMGGRPGSDYLLLSRRPGNVIIKSFEVLQSACPRSNVRDAGGIDTLITRYCAINTRRELLALARRMARLRPLGTLTYVGEPEDRPGDDAAAKGGARD